MRWLKNPLAVTLGVLAMVLSVALGTGWLERSLIYHPARGLDASPADLGMPFEDVWLTAEDGVRVHGWFVPTPDASITVLWFHGNAGNIGHRVGKLHALRREVPANYFLLSYRGYGRSEGVPSEEGIYQDAEAALAYLHSRDDVRPDGVVYFGQSLGAAVAVHLATHRPPLTLILESAFPSVPHVARDSIPWLPVDRLLRSRYDALRKLPSVHVPTLSLHGREDDVVPLALGRLLHDAANEPKRLVVVEGAGHNDVHAIDPRRYAEVWREFIDEWARRPRL
jgi:uncharacterized protein